MIQLLTMKAEALASVIYCLPYFLMLYLALKYPYLCK